MSEFAYPLRPGTPETTLSNHSRRIDQLERRAVGPWHNAGDPGEPTLSGTVTPVAGYFGGVGCRWRRRLGGGTDIDVAVDGSDGAVVVTLPPGWYTPGEEKIPLTGHNSAGARAFYIDTSTGDVVIGV